MGWEKLLAYVSGQVDKDLQLKVEYLVAENRILRSQMDGRVQLTDEQRLTLAMIGKRLGRAALVQIASIVTPDTILGWHRRLVAAKFDGSANRKVKPPGRPPFDNGIVQQIVRMARENPDWGYRRIVGSLAAVQISVSHQTVKNVLEAHGIDPAPQRKGKTGWADFIKSHTDCLLATDFLTTEVWTAFGLVTHYILFFIHVGSRKVYLAGITTNPNDGWMRQTARNLTMSGCATFNQCRYLIRDRDTKFTPGFDMIFQGVGIEALKLPARSPNLNAFAERFVRSIKEECLDRMIFFGEASLRHAVTEYIAHYIKASATSFRFLSNQSKPVPAMARSSAANDSTDCCVPTTESRLREGLMSIFTLRVADLALPKFRIYCCHAS